MSHYSTFKDDKLHTYYCMDGDYIQIDTVVDTPNESEYYFRKLIINKIILTINYKSSIFDLSWKNQSAILNFVNLEETKLILDEFNLNGSNKTKSQLEVRSLIIT